jgi:hypothetical protein
LAREVKDRGRSCRWFVKMPSRSVLVLIVGLTALLVGAGAAPASAKVVVIDRAGHLLSVPLSSARSESLAGWTDDGTRLVVVDPEDSGGRALAVDALTGARAVLGSRPGLVALGPRGLWVSGARDDQGDVEVALRTGDGDAIARLAVGHGLVWALDAVSWSADGARVALVTRQEAIVLDTATGAVLLRTPADFVSSHGLSPDGGMLLVTRDAVVWRVDVATAANVRVARADRAQWSPTGRLAVFRGDRVWVDAPSGVLDLPRDARNVAWTPDGAALAAIVEEDAAKPCAPDREGVLAFAPGAPPQTLLAVREGRTVSHIMWSPDGTRAAIDLHDEAPPSPEDDPDRRGARHPWPKRIADDYAMVDPRGDRAVRRAVGRFAADLRGGMGRAHALRRLGRALNRIGEQPWGIDVGDTIVGEAIAEEASAWLHAAGFAGIDGLIELDGEGC